MKTDVTSIIRELFGYILALFLCITILAVFIPLDPWMPASGLDASWMFAMNQGVARGLVFGKDIVFTFGPYACIYTRVYDPATDQLMLCGSLFLGISYAILLLLLAKGEKSYGLVLFGIFLACLLDSRDALFFSYPLMVALVAYRVTLPDNHPRKLLQPTSVEYCAALLFAPLGLLPLIKGSLLPICAAISILCGGMFWRSGMKALAYLAVGIPAFCCVLSWRFSGQPISALFRFLVGTGQVISGYTEAMSFPGNGWECVLFILASMLILLVTLWAANNPKISRWFLCISYALFLFTAFKAGFVRHDPWHNVTAGTSILAGGLLLVFVLGEKASFLPIAMALMVWAFIGHGTIQTTAEDISVNLRGTFGRTFHGARTRVKGEGDLHKQYGEGLDAIRADFSIPMIPGTMDIYSSNQSWLLASGNAWAPRPVTQSYSAFTPELAELNLRHLQDANAPDNILFRVEPIDGRLPSLEDGLSWPALMNNYSVQKIEGQSAYLRKRAQDTKDVAVEENDLCNARPELGKEVTIPESNDPLFARMEIAPTLLGRALAALFKPPELFISIRLRDGRETKYRAISTMMKTDFLITPLVKNTQEFVLLAVGGKKYLAGNEVKSFTISSEYGGGLLWNKTYSLRLRKLNLRENTETENSLLFEKMSNDLPESISASSTTVCEGMIESVNGSPPRSGIPTVGNILSVSGWMTISGGDGIVPDSDFVTLTSESGKTIYVRARSTPRNDVRRHFKQPGMQDPGYEVLIDVSSLSGHYLLGLARIYKGHLEVCQQFKVPIQIAR